MSCTPFLCHGTKVHHQDGCAVVRFLWLAIENYWEFRNDDKWLSHHVYYKCMSLKSKWSLPIVSLQTVLLHYIIGYMWYFLGTYCNCWILPPPGQKHSTIMLFHCQIKLMESMSGGTFYAIIILWCWKIYLQAVCLPVYVTLHCQMVPIIAICLVETANLSYSK